MSADEPATISRSKAAPKLPIAAAIVALIGLTDALYLTIHHYTAAPVPCGEGFDCEMVLNSSWSEIQGIPLAAFGAVSYFIAFSLALLTAFGDSRMWRLLGILTTLMAAFSGFLIYVQAFRVHAFCQYCLLSAATTFTLFIFYLISIFLAPRRAA